jgi:hypothetical protein
MLFTLQGGVGCQKKMPNHFDQQFCFGRKISELHLTYSTSIIYDIVFKAVIYYILLFRGRSVMKTVKTSKSCLLPAKMGVF